MDVLPKKCPDDVYNLWKAYDIENKGKDCTCKAITNPHIFQYPELQTPIALVFQGEGGEGKSNFWKLIGKLMSKSTFFSTEEPEKLYLRNTLRT
ncbi:unnamed protein product [Bathycoccus prasinos]